MLTTMSSVGMAYRHSSRAQLHLCAVLFLLTLLSGCASWRDRKNARMVERGLGIYHPVHRGESLYALGQVYGISVEEITKYNRISDPDVIMAGDMLFIPGATEIRHPASYRSRSSSRTQRKTTVAARDRASPSVVRSPPDSGQTWKEPKVYRPRISKDGLIWPVYEDRVRITSRFGMRNGRMHKGLDLGGDHGDPILAAADGVVSYIGKDGEGPGRTYGNFVIIDHGGGLLTLYAHLSRFDVRKIGQKVRQGSRIGKMGSTGRSTGTHLHFEVIIGGDEKDPLHYLPQVS